MKLADRYPAKMRVPQAAEYLGLSQSTLAKMRLRGDGPPYLKLGGKIVVYDIQDIESWLAASRRHSTSELREASDAAS